VLNLQAGKGRSTNLWAAIQREFSGDDIVISSEPPKLSTRKPSHIEDPLWPSGKSGAPDMVVAVGGDGTVNRVVNTVVDHNIPVGIIPCGSSNDLARTLGISGNFDQACQTIRAARLTDIDLVSVNGRYFTTCGGFGLSGDVAQRANSWRRGRGRTSRLARRLSRGIYPLALLRELSGGWRPPVARIICQDEDRVDAWFSLLVSNQPDFGGFSASPKADHRDGRLDICRILAPSKRLRMLWISLRTYLGQADACSEVSQVRAREVTILSELPVSFFGDGEILDRGRFFRVQVHPRALWVAAPNGGNSWQERKRSQEQQKQLVKYYLRRPSVRLSVIGDRETKRHSCLQRDKKNGSAIHNDNHLLRLRRCAHNNRAPLASCPTTPGTDRLDQVWRLRPHRPVPGAGGAV
jgi:diacylglycerol kinase (ATP)